MLAYVVHHDEETEELGGKRRPWTGGHHTATCLCQNANPGRCGKRRMFYHYAIEGPAYRIRIYRSQCNHCASLSLRPMNI